MTDYIDEALSDSVRKYPALYDKSNKGHHDRTLIKNCWVKVATECGLEDDKEAIRLFGNLKKRYNKTRNQANKPSGLRRHFEALLSSKNQYKMIKYRYSAE